MSDLSARLNLPFIAPAQAQKHVTHNEALVMLDTLVQTGVIAFDLTAPPTSPAEGALYGVGDNPTGDWVGQAGNFAVLQNGGWMFLEPQDGWRAWDIATSQLKVFTNGAWTALLAAGQLDGLGINTAWDETNRLAVQSDAALFTNPAGSHQLKINKADTTDTASMLFQSAYIGHAEMGLSGGLSFAIKVSADGSTWTEALSADPMTGAISTPAVVLPSGDVQAALDELALRSYGRESVAIASGTITIGNARHIEITSSTAGVADTLTSIEGGYDGQIIVCREAAGSGDITYASDAVGGNIQLADNTSLTLAQSRDSLTLSKEGYYWRQIAMAK